MAQGHIFADKVAVVTGGASGIGLGIARQLVRAGARVVIADIDEGTVRASATEIGAMAIRCDVSDQASVNALAQRSLETMGRIDMVFNNAGIGPVAALRDMAMHDWRWLMDINLFGMVHGIQAFLPMLEANSDGGHIVNTGSIASFTAMPGLGAYSASKFAALALTDALAEELEKAGSKVKATLICPGTVATNLARTNRNRPSHLGPSSFQDIDLQSDGDFADCEWMDPDLVGHIVLDGLVHGARYIFTHPDMMAGAAARFDGITQAIAFAQDRKDARWGQGE